MLPKSKKVFIGEKEFVLKEMTCSSRDVLLQIIGSFTFADMLKSFFPVLEGFNAKLEGANDEEKIIEVVKLSLQDKDMWGALMACIIKVTGISPTIICLSLSEGVHTDDNELYIRNNMTMSQESEILGALIELNSLPSTVKNYSALIVNLKSLFQKTS